LGSVSGWGKGVWTGSIDKRRFYRAAWRFFCSHNSFVHYHPRSGMYRYTTWRPVTITTNTRQTKFSLISSPNWVLM
jgi:hypothetical protein